MDVSQIYEDAVADVRRMIGGTFQAPDLRVEETREGISRRVVEDDAITIDPAGVRSFNEDGLRSVLAVQLRGSLTDTIEAEIRDIGDAVPDDYGDVDLAVSSVNIRPALADRDAALAYDPGSAELGVSPTVLDRVDPAGGTVEAPLSTLLTQAVVHAHHNAPLYDHPGYTATEPYLMSGTATTGSREALRETVSEARSRFSEDHSVSERDDIPTITLIDQTAGSIDLGSHAVRFDRRLTDMMNRDRLRLELQEWFKAFYDDALRDTLRDRAPAMAERYAAHGPDIEIEQAYFDDLADAAAKHSHEDHLIRFDRSKMRYLDTNEQRFRSDGVRTTGDHELTHEIDFANNPVTRQYWSSKPAFDGAYKEDYRNAVVEAITTFEQYISGGRQDAEAVDAIDDPWAAPFFLRGLLAIDDGDDPGDVAYDPLAITNPYEFGLYTALSVREGFAHRYGEEDATDLTRDLLYSVTTTPGGLLGIIERSFDMRPEPNYPRTLRVYDGMARDADDAGDLLSPAADSIADDIDALGGPEGLTAADGDRALALFYDGKAVLEVYGHRAGGMVDAPAPFDRLDGEITELQQRYG